MCQIRSGNVYSPEALCVAGPHSICYEPGRCKLQLLDCLGVSGGEIKKSQQNTTKQYNQTAKQKKKRFAFKSYFLGILEMLAATTVTDWWSHSTCLAKYLISHTSPAFQLVQSSVDGLRSLPALRYKHTACFFLGKTHTLFTSQIFCWKQT